MRSTWHVAVFSRAPPASQWGEEIQEIRKLQKNAPRRIKLLRKVFLTRQHSYRTLSKCRGLPTWQNQVLKKSMKSWTIWDFSVLLKWLKYCSFQVGGGEALVPPHLTAEDLIGQYRWINFFIFTHPRPCRAGHRIASNSHSSRQSVQSMWFTNVWTSPRTYPPLFCESLQNLFKMRPNLTAATFPTFH